jgi:uncharacterized membrane protein
MSARTGGSLWVALAGAGLAVSGYLTAVHYDASVPLACAHVGLVDCGAVLTSPESVWLGLPVSAWGMAWFGVALALGVRSLARDTLPLYRARLAWSVLGAAAVVYLVYTELLVIGRLCLWCTAVHALVLALFVQQALAAPPQRS